MFTVDVNIGLNFKTTEQSTFLVYEGLQI